MCQGFLNRIRRFKTKYVVLKPESRSIFYWKSKSHKERGRAKCLENIVAGVLVNNCNDDTIEVFYAGGNYSVAIRPLALKPGSASPTAKRKLGKEQVQTQPAGKKVIDKWLNALNSIAKSLPSLTEQFSPSEINFTNLDDDDHNHVDDDDDDDYDEHDSDNECGEGAEGFSRSQNILNRMKSHSSAPPPSTRATNMKKLARSSVTRSVSEGTGLTPMSEVHTFGSIKRIQSLFKRENALKAALSPPPSTHHRSQADKENTPNARNVVS